MAQAKGVCSQVVIDFETTYGSDPGSVAGIKMPFNTFSFKADRNLIEPATIRGIRDPAMPAHGNLNVSGPAVIPIDQIAIGYWLKALLGAPDTTGTGPYTHVFSTGDACSELPSMVIDLGFTDIAKYLKFNGVKIDGFSITAGGDGELTANLDLIGANETSGTSAYDSDPTELTFSRFNNFQASLEEGGSEIAIVQEVTINIRNNLDTTGYYIGGNGIRGVLPAGLCLVDGSIKAFFEDLTLYNKAVNTTESSLKLVFTSGSYSLTFLLNELNYRRGGPVVETPGGIYVELPFYAYYQDHADATVVKITLINSHASYA